MSTLRGEALRRSRRHRFLKIPMLVANRGTRYFSCRRGSSAVNLTALPYEQLLPLPLETVRRAARIEEPATAHPNGILCGAVRRLLNRERSV
jgi:hypothetical protein